MKLIALWLLAAVASAQESVEFFRDDYGVAHVIAPTSDADAYFGAGYVAAEDRWYQMCVSRLFYEGRVAEFFANGDEARDAALIALDCRVRVLGLRRSAVARAAALDPETRELLLEYCAGVNRYRAEVLGLESAERESTFRMHPVDEREWTVADCIGVWLRMAHGFQMWGNKEWLARWNLESKTEASADHRERWVGVFNSVKCADGDATVRASDMSHLSMELLEFATKHKVPAATNLAFAGCTLGAAPPAFSEAIALHSSVTADKRFALLGAPRIRVRRPNELYEWHMQGATFNVRGAGVPGCPNIVAGSSSTTAWSATALALDMTDVFAFETDASRPSEYKWGEEFVEFRIDEVETVLVKGSKPKLIRVRWTEFGPVVHQREVVELERPIVDLERAPLPRERGLTIKTVLHERPDLCSATAMLRMYRADSLESFYAATEEWVLPSFNLIFAHDKPEVDYEGGGIGYALIGALPLRTQAGHADPFGESRRAGSLALDAKPANDWQSVYVPQRLKPHALAPTHRDGSPRSQIASANNMPIGTWYPLYSLVAKSGGNSRYRRLREFFRGNQSVAHAEMRLLFQDGVGANHRDLITIAEAMASEFKPLTPDARGGFVETSVPLEHLIAWRDHGATLRGLPFGHRSVVVAAKLKAAALRPDKESHPVLLQEFGAGQAAMGLFLDALLARMNSEAEPAFTREEVHLVQCLVDAAWLRSMNERSHAGVALYDAQDTSGWLETYTANRQSKYFGFHSSAELGNAGLIPATEPELDISWSVAPVASNHSSTIADVKAATFNQLVIPGYDLAESMLAIGITGSETDESQRDLWENGWLKRSPLDVSGMKRTRIAR